MPKFTNLKIIGHSREFDLNSVYCVFLIYLNKRHFKKEELEYAEIALKEAIEEIRSAQFIKGRKFFASKRYVRHIIYYGNFRDFYQNKFYNLFPETKTMFQNYILGTEVYDIEQFYKIDFTELIKNKEHLESFFFHMLLHYFQHRVWLDINRCYLRKTKPWLFAQ
jgi:hypothetical protein